MDKDQIIISLWDPKQIDKNLKRKRTSQKLNCGFLGQITLKESVFEKFLDNGSKCQLNNFKIKKKNFFISK